MIVYEAKAEANAWQLLKVNEALRTALFVRNSCLRYWLDGHAKSGYDLNKYTKVLSDNPAFPWVSKLNSSARQAMAERAWAAISRFFENCKNQAPGKKAENAVLGFAPSGEEVSTRREPLRVRQFLHLGKPQDRTASPPRLELPHQVERFSKKGFPRFRKLQTRASVEYKQSGWSLSECRNYITFTDKFGIGTMKLRGTRNLNYYQLKQIKRVRIVRRSDGIYVQFCIDYERKEKLEPTGKSLALDLGLTHFYTDSDGNKVENPRFLRKSEKALKKAQRRLSRCAKGSKNRAQARNRLGRKHLKLQRQRKDWCVKLAQCVIKSADFVAYENLQVRNMVKNCKLAKSISDASWSIFTLWLEYFGKVYGRVVVAVSPAYTSIDCSNCGHQVHKTLSTRTHSCPICSYTACRDYNASRNILNKGLELFKNTEGHSVIYASGESDPCLEKVTSLSKSSRRKKNPRT